MHFMTLPTKTNKSNIHAIMQIMTLPTRSIRRIIKIKLFYTMLESVGIYTTNPHDQSQKEKNDCFALQHFLYTNGF